MCTEHVPYIDDSDRMKAEDEAYNQRMLFCASNVQP